MYYCNDTVTIQKYTIDTKVCGHPFKLVGLAISATPVADRRIQLSTVMAVEWPY